MLSIKLSSWSKRKKLNLWELNQSLWFSYFANRKVHGDIIMPYKVIINIYDKERTKYFFKCNR